MDSVYNVIGPTKVVIEMLETYTLEDEFEHDNGEERDVNVKLREDEVDDFIDWCEEHGLEPTLL